MGYEDRDWYKEAQRAKQNSPQGGPIPRPPARRSSPNFLSMILLWLVIGGILYMLVKAFIPGFEPPSVSTDAAGAIVLNADRKGNYEIGGAINGVPVEFIVDTGASTVAVSQGMAAQMGLSGCLPSESSTANGKVGACIAVAHDLAFGSFRMKNVPVAVMPNMHGMALLGMNALGTLHMTQSNGQMKISVGASRG